ncbi:transport energizing protein, ExbD/TolR family [Bacteriovorax sp. BAL6_X]|uniref:ExbD/TolR family protein n=1 Tax=Bacteriovorax sp. BAL6_X TaxID=1201290 RepID=UPI000385E394|nr:biopolymer transporter ExbD [Bacteriovorax sp. BAL6_X]EPZ49441.1 transport energizing protein, ExbD/TolR family [Bacteriovorax sp. BAL6_X]
MSSRTKRTRQEANADITPLIDVVFLLLIFFMTSTVFKKSELALLLSLPKTESGEQASTDSKVLTIELSKEEVAIAGKKYTVEQLDAQLAAIKDKNKAIDLRVDQEVQYSRLVRILDVLKKYSLTNLSLITEK